MELDARHPGWTALAVSLALACAGWVPQLLAETPPVANAASVTVQPLTANEQQLARDIFQQLVEIDTAHNAGSTRPAAIAMRERFLEAGFPAADVQLVGPQDRFMNLVVRYKGAANSTKKPVLVIGHLDVVRVRKEDWSVDPFKLTEADGYFYGRGTQDMKDSDAAYVTSLLLLHKAGYIPQRDIILALTADEEDGGNNGVSWLLKNLPSLVKAEFAVNPDVGGVLLREGRAVEMDVALSEKTYADFDITVRGPGGHSSRPMPDNAIYEVADALGRIERGPFPIELNAASRAYLEAEARHETPEKKLLISRILGPKDDMASAQQLAQDPGYNAVLRTTCVATMMQAGEAKNALPSYSSANVNCRILPGHSPEEVRRQLVTTINDLRVKVTYKDDDGRLYEHAPTETAALPAPPIPAVMKILRSVTGAMWPGISIVPQMSAGSSDSVYTMAAGIPTYGISGMGIDQNDDRAHGRDERLRVVSFYDGVMFTRELVKQLGDM